RHTRCYRDWSSDVCSSDLCPSPRPGASVVGQDPLPGLHVEAGRAAVEQRNGLHARLVTEREEERLGAQVKEDVADLVVMAGHVEIGRASCRERVWGWGGAR